MAVLASDTHTEVVESLMT